LFFCLTISLALFTSSGWRRPHDTPVDDGRLRRWLLLLTAAVYGQILLGATVRHTGAGLAIPDFPLAYGQLVPPFWNPAVALHFAHRLGAVAVAALVVASAWRVWTRHRSRPELGQPAVVLAGAVLVQIALGGFVVLTGKQPIVNTLHVATGAIVLGTSLILTLRAFRARLERPVTP
jgi:cytochrome c oxidase assembly protein subunit 15